MKKPASIREIFAKNLRENRRKCGFSQEKLAENAGITTQYLAMMEIARKFPSSEVLERLAAAMGIKVYELFLIDHSPREELELLRRDIINEMKQTFDESLEKALSGKYKRRTVTGTAFKRHR
jgi:transcriptional regulator with XRE-family HTH domain